jgi:hypothetical protein
MKRLKFKVRLMFRDKSQISDYCFVDENVRAKNYKEAIKTARGRHKDSPISEHASLII